jgi:restriction system protein
MPPRNLLLAIALGAFAVLAHPFVFIGRFFGSRLSVARSKVDTDSWTPELLKRLEWRRFEELCAAYFETLGPANAAVLVQCSPWNAYRVGIKPVRALREAMKAGNVEEGVLVSPGKFTQEARAFAGKERISLIDGDELVTKISALAPEKALALLKLATQGDFRTPTCPACVVKMIPRKSTAHGRTYWGCRNYPACKHNFFETETS